MRYPHLIAELGRMCKRAGVGPAYPPPRPAETPAQARRVVGRPNNLATGGVLQQAAPQALPRPTPVPPQQPPGAARLPQVDGIL